MFLLADQLGARDFALEQVSRVHRTFGVPLNEQFDISNPPWTLDENELLDVRHQVALMVQHLTHPDLYPDPTLPPQVADPEPDLEIRTKDITQPDQSALPGPSSGCSTTGTPDPSLLLLLLLTLLALIRRVKPALPILLVVSTLILPAAAGADGYFLEEYGLLAVQGGERRYVLQTTVISLDLEAETLTGKVERVWSWGKAGSKPLAWEVGREYTFPVFNRSPEVVKGQWGKLIRYWNGIELRSCTRDSSVLLLPRLRSDNLFEIVRPSALMDRKLELFAASNPRQALEEYSLRSISQLEADLADRDFMKIAYVVLKNKGAATHEFILRNAAEDAPRGLLRYHVESLEPWQLPGCFHAFARHVFVNKLNLSTFLWHVADRHHPLFMEQAWDVVAAAFARSDLEQATAFLAQVCSSPHCNLDILAALEPPLDLGEASQLAVDTIVDCIFTAAEKQPDSASRMKTIFSTRLPQWKAVMGANRCERIDKLLSTSHCRTLE